MKSYSKIFQIIIIGILAVVFQSCLKQEYNKIETTLPDGN